MKTPDIMIGLEVHIQLDTKTKLFCSCSTKAHAPNTSVCPVCLGHPGSKPVLNKKTVEFGVMLGLALNCDILPAINFSRKTYFYPDMSKNYQITQYEVPLAQKGKIALDSGKEISISRLHLEEDPASLEHKDEFSLVDYNRSGIPLIELVTEPVMNTPDEAREFMKKLLGILRYLKIFDMTEGTVKADANVSIKESNFSRVEIKNITGFREIERAIEYEVQRQREAVKKNEKIVRETRGWDAPQGITRPQRLKETEEDYGYIFDPDLVTISITAAFKKSVAEKLPELPVKKSARFVKQFKIDAVDSQVISADPEVAAMFEEVAKKANPILSAHWIRRELLKILSTKSLAESKITSQHLAELFILIDKKAITQRTGQEIMQKLGEKPFSPKDFVEKHGLSAVADSHELEKLCADAVKENPSAVKDYLAGEEKAFNFLVGKVMAKTKGRARPDIITPIIKKLVKK